MRATIARSQEESHSPTQEHNCLPACDGRPVAGGRAQLHPEALEDQSSS